MSKFDRVLSDSELLDVYRSLDNPKRDRDSVVEAMAAAVDAAMGKLAEQADMFWDLANPEWSRESISCILLEDNDFDSSDVGKVIELMRAKSLPNISVLITSYDEEEGQITWRVIEND